MFSKGKSKDSEFEQPSQPSLIATNMVIKGQLESEGDIQLDGNVEGEVKAYSLTIGEDAVFNGTIAAEIVTIAGMVEGVINANQVRLLPTAKVIGDIFHESLSVEAGAFIQGTFKRRPVKLTEVSSTATEALSHQPSLEHDI